jgi:hypothetical protein
MTGSGYPVRPTTTGGQGYKGGTYKFLALGGGVTVTRQRSGGGSLGGNDRALFFRGAIDAGGKAVPPKLPESLDFDFWEVLIFLPEDRFGGGEDVDEVIEGGFRHFEFQMLYTRGQKLELSSPIRQSE